MHPLLAFFLGIIVATVYERKGWKGIRVGLPFFIAVILMISIAIFLKMQSF